MSNPSLTDPTTSGPVLPDGHAWCITAQGVGIVRNSRRITYTECAALVVFRMQGGEAFPGERVVNVPADEYDAAMNSGQMR